ncbi:DUF1631 family protein [Methylomonas methanica]|uniref:Diguanylate cyclase/phosphodiesterase n=1 Tax=Methylomonas methanica (strain DSM 25384 / MC09) TaxID=857087 RepID=F9ZVY8_METMM|nr:DUF1631 family protein [Methylomonas methanica]AEG00792.1 diguanylate cyclase/phosphodiesterase [Methylomonas methanica MC09]
MQSSSKKPKQRRHIRYAIELQAEVITRELERFDCIILDFCSHGIFLKITPAGAETALPTQIKIRFTTPSEIAKQTFEIDAQVMHRSCNGIGVMIENMPLAAFNALKAQTTQGVSVPTESDGDSKPFIYENFKLFLKQNLVEPLAGLTTNFFDTVSYNLQKANVHSEYFASRSELDDVVTTLQLNADTCVSEFCHSVIDQIDSITEHNQKKEDITHFDRPLSLVEKEDFEDWLNMSAIIRKLTNHFEDSINQVTRELSRILGRSKTRINNPVSPAILCDCFREIILQFNLDTKTTKALYICFGKTLFESLPDFYQQVSAFLSILKSAEKKIGDEAFPTHKSLPVAHSGRNPEFVQEAHNVPLLQDSYNIDHSHQQSLAYIAGKLLDILNQEKFSDTDLPSDVDRAAQTIDYFDNNDITTAISQLQGDPSTKILQQDYAQLTDRLQQTLSKLNNSKVFSQRDSNRLEVYGKFFDTLLKDSNISKELQPYFENVYLPLLALPLQGNEFLDADSHPVKNILNQLAVLGQVMKGKKTPKKDNIKGFLEKVTTRIAREIPGSPTALLEIEEELDIFTKQVTKQIDSRIKHIIDVHEGQQKLAIARQVVQAEIDKRVSGRAVPTAIPMLLDAGWQHLLVLAELNKEKLGDRKAVYLNVIDDLMFWFYEQDSVLKIQTSSIQTTLTFIDDELNSSGTPAFERRQVVEELTALLLGVGNPKVRKTVQTIKFSTPNSNPIRLTDETNDQWTLLIDQLTVGEWLKIKNDVALFEPMKLIWIGDVPLIYVFVDAVGLKSLQFSKKELTALFKQGFAEKSDSLDMPLTERTTNSMLQEIQQRFVFNATHDPETNLMTRDEFIKQLKNELPKLGDNQHMLCHIEVLDFRLITNICGLSGELEMLKTITQLISDRLRPTDLLARLGDNSFAVLYKNCLTDEAFDLSKQLIKSVSSSHFKWQEKSFPITLSMGLAPFESSCIDIYQLLQQADAANLSAGHTGQNNVLVFAGDNENLQYQNKLLEWIGRIDTVFSEDRLFARCQMIAPIEPSQDNHVHYEILLGIRDEDGNIIPPDHFIPAVERSKRMHEIDKWVINTVFDWIDKNRQSFDNMDGFSINLSGESLNSEEFLQFLQALLHASTFPLEKLVFEITETVASENLTFTKNFIKAIKEFGCKFSLDDFGSGYSSYAYLKNLNVDFLKIDGAFVKDLTNNKADFAIVKSMNEIAHSLNLKTIAEYVESAEIKDILKDIGVDYGQGFFIHKPMPLNELKVEPKPDPELFYFEDNSFWEV